MKRFLRRCMKVYPIRFEPIYKNYIWGGERLRKKYHRKSSGDTIAESWEIVDRENEQSIVINGEYQKKSLHELVVRWQQKLLGEHIHFLRFPILIKLIDAKENLSIQVHPDNQSASLTHGESKNEVWYILEARDSSSVYAGLKPNTDKKIFKEALEKECVVDLIKKITVQKDDVIYIPGGRVHAICSGAMILEVQQNSDTTYRIYDWDRIGEDKKPRQLHLKEAMQTIRFDDWDNPYAKPYLSYENNNTQVWDLIKKPFFYLQKLIVHKIFEIQPDHKSFQVFFLLEGSGKLITDEGEEQMILGSCYLIAACAENIKIVSENTCEVIKVSLS